ncbi:MAG: class B sortase [Suipraeoptans sp.]
MTRKEQRRKRKEGKSTGGRGIVSTIILIIAIIVFCFAGYKLYGIITGYLEGRSEYKELQDLAITNDGEDDEQFRVDFDALMELNPDTIGWIRFYPEPSSINYPIVQTDNNSTYLSKTFSSNDNSVGAIFLNTYNDANFGDRNSIIYGHYMNDGTMFHKLWDYQDESFYKDNPYFYIYTPDNRELTYHIFSVARLQEDDEAYSTDFPDDAAFQSFIDRNIALSDYNTGVVPTIDDKIVSLSTCTSLNTSSDRWKVTGVLIETKDLSTESE